MKTLGVIAILMGLVTAGCGYHDHRYYGHRSDIRRAQEDLRHAGREAREELRRARQDLQRELRQAREDFRREMRHANREFRDEFGRW
jgi:membrane protein involved in colicin uptake